MASTPFPLVRRVLVTGGGTFLGDNIAAALLAEGVEVTLLVRPGAEEKIGALAQRARVIVADLWTPASLKGRGRGHDLVIHTVGGMKADPRQGLTYEWLNIVSSRNVANMCVSSGVPHMMLISTARAPWISADYVHAKREAELYMERIGLRASIIRAPLVYVRGRPRRLINRMISLFGRFPLLWWLGFNRIVPMPIDIMARGTARIALENRSGNINVYYAPDLRKRNTSHERRDGMSKSMRDDQLASAEAVAPIHMMTDDTPFGWTPESKRKS